MSLEDSLKANQAASVARPERRVPRFEFVATIELKDSATATRLSGRIAEISRHGCYMDIMNSLPVETPVKLRISREQAVFETGGKIIYVQPNLGMGIAFVDTAAEQLQILEAWLTQLSPL